MNFGIAFANAGPAVEPDYAASFAQLAEGLGFESLWTVEHVVVPAGYESAYPYARDGRMPGGENVDVPDPMVWLAYVAAVTKTIKLATGIVILPQRNPLVFAKECASLDRLSTGRFVLGVGVGWLKEEFDALGVPFAERGAITDEYISAMREVWGSQEPTFTGNYTSFSRAKSFPKPANNRQIPVIIGGHTKAAARRAGRLGDGFFPGISEGLEDLLHVVRESAEQAGRSADAIEITTASGRSADDVKRLADIGVSRVTVSPMGADLETCKRNLGSYSETVMSQFR
jgi:probable F420-dependent oxidoreductase